MKTKAEIQKRKLEIRSKMENESETLTEEDLTKLEEELRGLEADERIIEKRANIMSLIGKGEIGNEFQKPQEEVRSYGVDSKEYRSAFFKTLAGVELNDVEKRAMTTNTSSAGVAVPTQTLNKIYEKIKNDSIIYSKVTVSHLSGNLSIPIEGTTNDVERKAEGADGTIKDDTLGELKLGAKKYIKLVRLTCELENTAIDALEDYIVTKLSKKLLLAFDADIINGTGTNGAKGILKSLTASQTTGTTAWTVKDLLNLVSKISARARRNAYFVMSTNTLYNEIKAIVDDNNRPIFDLESNKVLGREVVESDDVPDGTIIFGDLSEYMFNWSKDATISKSEETAFASGDVVYRILALADGGLADLGAIAVMSKKA